MENRILREAKFYYDLGFAIHWIKPRSKRPVESGWTTGPRKSWEDLKRTYRDGMNVGVRLGEASSIGGYSLVAFDMDIKSTEARHLLEARGKLEKIIGRKLLPTVESGRGGGSVHLYGLVKGAFKSTKLLTSDEEVKLYMPSVDPSKRELELLTIDEIRKGFRLRPAWDIDFMAEGRQVVMPPSIHPDSGKEYKWKVGWSADAAVLSSLDFLEKAETEKGTATEGPVKSLNRLKLEGFTPSIVDLDRLPYLGPDIKAAIVEGAGVTDESAKLLSASRALFGNDLNRNQVLSVLTDRRYFLGKTAYRHAKTNDREVAANWLYKFTLAKLERERDSMFSEPLPSEEPTDIEPGKPKGFYRKGKRGGLIPLYGELLIEFDKRFNYRTIDEMKSVYVFNGTHYEVRSPLFIKGFAEDSFNPCPSETIRLEFLNKVFANKITPREFFSESVEGKVNFKNGVLEIDDEGFMGPVLSEHSPAFGFRGVLPYNYDAKADCPFFKRWLLGIMVGDQDLMNIVQEFMGYIVRGGEYKYHKALWLGGSGRNGKSTFIDVLKALIGEGYFSTVSIRSLIHDKFSSAELDGKIANFSEETSPEELKDSGPFKNLTGDGDINAQKKFGALYRFRNRAKLIMTYNQIPEVSDLTAGMRSRPIIIPFDKVIKDAEQDRTIKYRLFEELPGIFNFALKGWQRLEMQNGFSQARRSSAALKNFEEYSDKVFQWVEHNLVFSQVDDFDARLSPTQIYATYRQTTDYRTNETNFYRRLNLHPEVAKRRRKSNGKRFYIGVKIER